MMPENPAGNNSIPGYLNEIALPLMEHAKNSSIRGDTPAFIFTAWNLWSYVDNGRISVRTALQYTCSKTYLRDCSKEVARDP